jgi:hypothetical protein
VNWKRLVDFDSLIQFPVINNLNKEITIRLLPPLYVSTMSVEGVLIQYTQTDTAVIRNLDVCPIITITFCIEFGIQLS